MRKETFLAEKMIRNRGKQMKEMWKPGEREVETVEAIWMVAMRGDTATDDSYDANDDHGNAYDADDDHGNSYDADDDHGNAYDADDDHGDDHGDADHHRMHHLDLDRGTCKAHCSN